MGVPRTGQEADAHSNVGAAGAGGFGNHGNRQRVGGTVWVPEGPGGGKRGGRAENEIGRGASVRGRSLDLAIGHCPRGRSAGPETDLVRRRGDCRTAALARREEAGLYVREHGPLGDLGQQPGRFLATQADGYGKMRNATLVTGQPVDCLRFGWEDRASRHLCHFPGRRPTAAGGRGRVEQYGAELVARRKVDLFCIRQGERQRGNRSLESVFSWWAVCSGDAAWRFFRL